jgi:membrane-associated phospholipid phosphatase
MLDPAEIEALNWYRQPVRRLLWHLPLKVAGLVLYMLVFFAAYFALLRHPLFAVSQVPLTALDRLVPFCPQALVLYLSLWCYVSLAPSWLMARDELLAYLWSVIGLGASGCAFFLFWPNAVPPPQVDWSLHPGFAFLKTVDDAGNACPSLHVAFAVFSALYIGVMLRRMRAPAWMGLLNWAWCLGIVWSTLAVRQHVALDVYAGSLLGAAWFVLDRRVVVPLACRRSAVVQSTLNQSAAG